MEYTAVSLNSFLQIKEIYTIHYFEYMRDFSFAGETHGFWEFLYVDKGIVEICMDHTKHILRKGTIAFHQPNEFHSVKATGETAPNLIVISFTCESPAMDFFRHQILALDEKERALLADIFIEARKLFSCPLNDPYTHYMPKKEAAPAGCEQLISLYLELFLIHLYRRYTGLVKPSALSVQRNSADIFKRICDYMDANLHTTLTLEQICKDNMLSRSQLQKVFQKECRQSVMAYFFQKKIEAAKQMIRNGKLNFSQIAEQLGYSSIHYFSRQFKKMTNMSPSEYASSVKAMSERS